MAVLLKKCGKFGQVGTGNLSMPGRCRINRKIENFAEIAQLVEHQLPKLRVASSNLVFRSFKPLHPRDAAAVCL